MALVDDGCSFMTMDDYPSQSVNFSPSTYHRGQLCRHIIAIEALSTAFCKSLSCHLSIMSLAKMQHACHYASATSPFFSLFLYIYILCVSVVHLSEFSVDLYPSALLLGLSIYSFNCLSFEKLFLLPSCQPQRVSKSFPLVLAME